LSRYEWPALRLVRRDLWLDLAKSQTAFLGSRLLPVSITCRTTVTRGHEGKCRRDATLSPSTCRCKLTEIRNGERSGSLAGNIGPRWQVDTQVDWHGGNKHPGKWLDITLVEGSVVLMSNLMRLNDALLWSLTQQKPES